MKAPIRLNLKRHSFVCSSSARGMSENTSKQITVRFELTDWIRILEAADEAGIKPVQFVRSTVLRTLNGQLIDVKSIESYFRQQEKDDLVKRRGF